MVLRITEETFNTHEAQHRRALGFTEETTACFNCKHFVTHYTHVDGFMILLHCGHCVYPKMKIRTLTDTCEHFASRGKRE